MTNSVTVPLPTSANRIWRTYGRRTVKNPDYVTWQNQAAAIINLDRKLGQFRPVAGNYDLTITLPQKTRCDADNYLKGASDILQATGIVENDKLCRNIHLVRGKVPKGHCQITVNGI